MIIGSKESPLLHAQLHALHPSEKQRDTRTRRVDVEPHSWSLNRGERESASERVSERDSERAVMEP